MCWCVQVGCVAWCVGWWLPAVGVVAGAARWSVPGLWLRWVGAELAGGPWGALAVSSALLVCLLDAVLVGLRVRVDVASCVVRVGGKPLCVVVGDGAEMSATTMWMVEWRRWRFGMVSAGRAIGRSIVPGEWGEGVEELGWGLCDEWGMVRVERWRG